MERRWRKRHIWFFAPMRSSRRRDVVRLRGTFRSGAPNLVATVVRVRVTGAENGSTFSGAMRPSLPALLKMLSDIAVITGGWFVVAFDARYRDLGGFMTVIALSVLGAWTLRWDVRVAGNMRTAALRQARGALGVHSTGPGRRSQDEGTA